jgi:succinate-semialdehyde dehydrogenase/glutarate-semialdehyde dehydrogenase
MGIESVNPATGEVLKTFDSLSDLELATKLDRAATAFSSYRNTPFSYRASRMLKAAEILDRKNRASAAL